MACSSAVTTKQYSSLPHKVWTDKLIPYSHSFATQRDFRTPYRVLSAVLSLHRDRMQILNADHSYR
jgi:hypothetical protein